MTYQREHRYQRGREGLESPIPTSFFFYLDYLSILSQTVSPSRLSGPTGPKWTFVYLRSVVKALEIIY